jgi:protein phosphatase
VTEIGESNPDFTVGLPNVDSTPLRIAWAAATDTGRRRAANEDSYVAQSPMFAVADGMGGHSAGDLASAAVVERLAEMLTDDFLTARGIERALEEATADITEIAADSVLGVGTTVTGAALTLQDGEAHLAVFNIGDSRVYCFDRNELFQVTVDHSVVQEMVEAGALTRDEADHHPDSNVITRAVGFNAQPVPDFWMVQLHAGLRFLICTDGLTKEVSDDRIRMHLAAGLTAAETASALIDAALASGGRDNVTTIIVDILEAPEPLDVEDTAPRSTRA